MWAGRLWCKNTCQLRSCNKKVYAAESLIVSHISSLNGWKDRRSYWDNKSYVDTNWIWWFIVVMDMSVNAIFIIKMRHSLFSILLTEPPTISYVQWFSVSMDSCVYNHSIQSMTNVNSFNNGIMEIILQYISSFTESSDC